MQAWAPGDSRAVPPNKGNKEAPRGPNDCLEGVTIVISGVLDSMERDEAEDYIKRHGGKVTGSVSGKTTYLLVGTDCGKSKYNKAKAIGTTFMDEDGLFAMVAACGPQHPKVEPPPALGSTAAPSPAAAPSGPSKLCKVATAQFAAGAGSSGGAGTSRAKAEDTTPLWVNKYKPSQPAQLIGNGKNIADLRRWLNEWEAVHIKGTGPGAGATGKDKPMKAVLISGPPGIGKSSAAAIIAKQLGFVVKEVNASDTRGKSDSDVKDGIAGKASNAIRELVTNRSMNFGAFSKPGAAFGEKQKMVLIMDEVDGMSGGDRGGIMELITCIKISKIPIICICNDKYNQKLKSLQNYVLDMPFSRPTKQQILNRMLTIAKQEGIEMNAAAMEALIEVTNNDIRLIINQLQMRRLTRASFEFDDIKSLAKKDIDMGPFTAVDKLCAPDANRLSVNDRLNLVFQDSDIIPLFIQENYLQYRPYAAGANDLARLQHLAKSATCISEGDMMNRSVRQRQNWGLMPYANIVSSVMPASIMRGSREVFGMHPGERNFNRFPGWLGKNSTHGKNRRLLHELHSHATTSNEFKADSAAMRDSYLPLLKVMTTRPMKGEAMGGKDKEGIQEVMEVMDGYCLTRADWESMQDLCKFKGNGPLFQDPAAGIATATKSAFTKECNKGSRVIHSGILIQEAKKGKKKGVGTGVDDDDDEEGEGKEGEGEDEDNDGPKKPKLSAKRLAAIGFVAKDEGKGKKKPAAKKSAAKKPAAKKK